MGTDEYLSHAGSVVIEQALEWLRWTFMKAVLDMERIGRYDHLSVLWTTAAGPTRSEAIAAMTEVMLLRENADLMWLFGSLDCMGA